jgi:hypothetical protein
MIAQARIAEWYNTEMGVRYLVGFFDDMNRKHNFDARIDVETLAAIQYRMVADSEPVYVGYDACELIDHARETFEPEAVLPSDPFVPSGFALLAKPLLIPDAPVTPTSPWRSPNGLIPVRAISWLPIHTEDMEQGTFWIGFYTFVEDEVALDDSRYKDEPLLLQHMRKYCPLGLVHQWQWTWGKDPSKWMMRELDILPDDDPDAAPIRAKMQAQLVQTMWRIGSQFTPARQQPQAPIRRDAKRKGLNRHEEVNVIVLRRTSPAREHEPTGRHLTVRFPVNGYWARRHTVDGPRQVWVKAHMKGDPSHPLVVKKRAWEFKR